jgi:hypothetical protein
MRLLSRSLRFAAPLTAVMLLCAAAPDTVTDQDLIKYAQNDFDRGEMMYKHVQIGVHNGAQVVADFPCADVCPDKTTRIIHYELDDGQACSSVHGVERTIAVPTGLGNTKEQFCVPRALAARGLGRTPQY